MDPTFFWPSRFSLSLYISYRSPDKASRKKLEIRISVSDLADSENILVSTTLKSRLSRYVEGTTRFVTQVREESRIYQSHLPGITLLPCFGLRSLARMTSTWRQPFAWINDSWISPRQRAPSACLPTIWAGPRSSMNSRNCPSPAIRRLGDQLRFSKLYI